MLTDVFACPSEAPQKDLADTSFYQIPSTACKSTCMKIQHEHHEYREAAKNESLAVLRLIADATDNEGIMGAMVTSRSMVGDFFMMPPDGAEDEAWEHFAASLPFAVEGTDMLIAVARKLASHSR